MLKRVGFKSFHPIRHCEEAVRPTKQSRGGPVRTERLDCFVAARLAMTIKAPAYRLISPWPSGAPLCHRRPAPPAHRRRTGRVGQLPDHPPRPPPPLPPAPPVRPLALDPAP